MKQYMNVMGRLCKDKVTGYVGVVISVSFDLYGCVQVAMAPKADDKNKKEDGHWFDHKRLEILEETPVMELPDYSLAEQKHVSAPKERGRESGPAEKPRGMLG